MGFINFGAFAAKTYELRQQIEQTAAGRAFTTLGQVGAASIPGSLGDPSREQLATRLEAPRTQPVAEVSRRTAQVLIPRTSGEATINLALGVVPVGRVGGVATRAVSRAPVRAAATRTTSRTVSRASGTAVARTTAPRATTRTTRAAAGSPGGGPRPTGFGLAGGRAGRGAAGRTATGAGTRTTGRLLTPKRILVGGAVTGGVLATTYLLGKQAGQESVIDLFTGEGDGGRGGGGGTGASGDGGGGGGSPNFATDPFFGNITAGIGSMFDRVGAGIADLLRALGIPIGEGTGKAIAIGGTAILVAIALSKLSKGRAGASSGPKAKAKAKGGAKATPKAKAGGRGSKGMAAKAKAGTAPRGPGGKFLPAGGA